MQDKLLYPASEVIYKTDGWLAAFGTFGTCAISSAGDTRRKCIESYWYLTWRDNSRTEKEIVDRVFVTFFLLQVKRWKQLLVLMILLLFWKWGFLPAVPSHPFILRRAPTAGLLFFSDKRQFHSPSPLHCVHTGACARTPAALCVSYRCQSEISADPQTLIHTLVYFNVP